MPFLFFVLFCFVCLFVFLVEKKTEVNESVH